MFCFLNESNKKKDKTAVHQSIIQNVMRFLACVLCISSLHAYTHAHTQTHVRVIINIYIYTHIYTYKVHTVQSKIFCVLLKFHSLLDSKSGVRLCGLCIFPENKSQYSTLQLTYAIPIEWAKKDKIQATYCTIMYIPSYIDIVDNVI